jgi:hypothetical protein
MSRSEPDRFRVSEQDTNMAKEPAIAEDRPLATADDIGRILGALDEAKLLDIVALRPSILDVEETSLWLSGDSDIFGAGQPLKPVAGEIVAVLTADEEEELRSAK